LVQKYFDGETTLEEERLLGDFFMQGPVPEELMPYREWFAGLATDDSRAFAPEGQPFTAAVVTAMIEERERRKRLRLKTLRYATAGIAASLVITLGALFLQQQPDYRNTFDDPEQALVVAEETLAFVSAKYNKGLEKLENFEKLSDSVQPAQMRLTILRKGFGKADLFGYREEP